MPPYWLSRPGPAPDAATRAEFDALLAAVLADGPGAEIDYRLAAPKWQFLCHVADRGEAVLHAPAASLEPVEPLAKLPVEPADFPLRIRGYDLTTQLARIEADPGGFPWLAADEV